MGIFRVHGLGRAETLLNKKMGKGIMYSLSLTDNPQARIQMKRKMDTEMEAGSIHGIKDMITNILGCRSAAPETSRQDTTQKPTEP